MAARRITATGLIVLVTIAVSGLVSLSNYEMHAAIVAGVVPARLSGLLDFSGVLAVPAFLTPLSSAFLHAGFLHLAMNMLMLGFTGREAERALGPAGIVLLYLAGAYAAAAAQWAADPESIVPMIGASGAASAVIGAYSLLFGRSRARPIGPIPAQAVHVLWLAAAWIGVNLLIGVLSVQAGYPIAAWAHVGGFLIGLALAKPLFWWRWRRA
jgi:membrane associated rhomboid family serine protease